MEQATIQIVGIVAVIGLLLGWVVRTVLTWLMARVSEKDNQIMELVKQNQKNVDAFTETINHQQSKFNKSIDTLAKNIGAQTEVFKQLIKK